MSDFQPENVSDFVTGFLLSRGFLFQASVTKVDGVDDAPSVATVELLGADGETSIGKMAFEVQSENFAAEACSAVADSLYDELIPARPMALPERMVSVISLLIKKSIKDASRGDSVGLALNAVDDILDSYLLREGCVGMANIPDRLKNALEVARGVYQEGVSCTTGTTKDGHPKK